tara:strand:+ start:773 stop:1192 length:420 start_codon:yes stop_codon:yes gene_type:complete
MYNLENCGWCNKLRNWAIDSATVLFDDNHNDLRALPKTVRLQILVVLSFVWSTVFTVYFFSISTMLWGWVGLVIGHLAIIFAAYFTFKQFHNASKRYIDYKFGTYHSAGRTRGYMIGRDKKGNPYKVHFDPNDPGGEHE